MKRALFIGAFLAIAAAALAARVEDSFKNLPFGWKVEKSFVVPADETAAIGARLGGRIKNLSNTILSVHSRRIQVNVIECATPEDAGKIHKSLLQMKSHPAFCLKSGDSVVEFVGDDVALAIKAAHELGLKPKPSVAKYKISFDAAPIETCDYMSWNNMAVLFWKLSNEPEDEALKKQIAELAKRFQFGTEIALRTCGRGKTAYAFQPDASRTEATAGGEITKYIFKDLPLKVGVPCVAVVATVTVGEGGATPTERKADETLLAPTEFWPSDDAEIIALAEKITKGCKSPEDKVKALLKWLQPGKNIKFGGAIVGSRYGVKKTLEQGFGHCWDFSDCFITFCRALKIPSRQVAGRLYGGGGHIWAEVLFDGKKWQQVDPTGGGLVTCGIYYVAYLTSEDGKMPLVFLSRPKVELLEE